MAKKSPVKLVSSHSNVLDEAALMAIPVAQGQIFTFRTEDALAAKRRFLYGVNSNNAAGRQWMTRRWPPKSKNILVIRLS